MLFIFVIDIYVSISNIKIYMSPLLIYTARVSLRKEAYMELTIMYPCIQIILKF